MTSTWLCVAYQKVVSLVWVLVFGYARLHLRLSLTHLLFEYSCKYTLTLKDRLQNTISCLSLQISASSFEN